MYQRITIIGNLGADPETRSTKSGDTVANLRVAVNKKTKDGDITEWFRVVAFKQSADFASKYLKKGNMVLVDGEMRTSKWTDKDGNDHYKTELIANNIRGLTRDSGSGYNGDSPKYEPPHPSDLDDSIPF